MTIVQEPAREIRIGVDCGGTNTDAAVLDLTPGASQVVLAAAKTPTTPQVTHGIQKVISTVLKQCSDVSREDVRAVSIGTTHFVNALVQRAEEGLERVAVIRLCGPFSRRTPPFAGFPYELREILQGPCFFVEGGLQIDGSEISSVVPSEIEEVCEKIKADGIRAVAISAVYAPIDFTLKQEEQVEEIVQRCIPGVFTTCSKKVANISLLERENATILNTSLLPFAHVTVKGFREAATALGLTCPVFVTSNDGTLLSLEEAAPLPIRTFSSGPTNSMRGASFLAKLADPDAKKETALVVDIGGTTTEVGVLLPTGFPRQAASHHELCGVRLNFAMPHVTSIGLGGGSLVRQDPSTGKVTVGPESVGYKITNEALVFGGNTLTATDIAVAAGVAEVGDVTAVKAISQNYISAARERMKAMLEVTVDSMKTSAQDIPVYLVGGGALLAPDHLSGASKVHRFPHYECANAVGAAIAQVAGAIDTVEVIEGKPVDMVKHEIEQKAIQRAIDAGADPKTVKIIESEAIPIAYTAGRCRFFVKAAGEWSGSSTTISASTQRLSEQQVVLRPNPRRPYGKEDKEWLAKDILEYRPQVSKGVWTLSALDLDFIRIGTYILGCGGGGDPQQDYLCLREMVNEGGAKIRVIELNSLKPDQMIGWGGIMGSPEVGAERCLGEEYNEATVELYKFLNIQPPSGLLALEIGGSNGMINMISGSDAILDIPVVDGDFMGRAYPTGWQTTPNIYDDSGRGLNLLPSCISSGDGNILFMTKAKFDNSIDASLRAACCEMGTQVGHAVRPLSVDSCQKAMVRNTVSLSWRLGRAVTLANKQHNIANVGSVIIDAIGGSETGKILFAGKIVEINRRVYKGHSIGEVVIAATASDDESETETYSGVLKIPFKNENLYAVHEVDGKSEVVATVPDLITVLDAANGEALGTPDYKYGLHVVVFGVTAAPQWTETERGLKMGDLRSFGIDGIPYKPIGKYIQPKGVIEEYNEST
ncbi:hypothetical protein I302_107973 [Kwoniella bestiolae CBS 10118]|uniref:Hydantoinase n=1 Tax=Kwoniella bestiolae CBS 10118 TaxID=1296100 RepID=A0A1B9FX19_9TREE|nr:hypothetical protein I302_07663 [Kwoniella bestiolae CBS 10118]OCF23309.1 hypothetical protein I302_07663 [Kwoniella bestiolae CBS 10118]